jgi:hypothetical protein
MKVKSSEVPQQISRWEVRPEFCEVHAFLLYLTLMVISRTLKRGSNTPLDPTRACQIH